MSKSKEADTPRLCEQMTQGKPKHVLVLVLDLQSSNPQTMDAVVFTIVDSTPQPARCFNHCFLEAKLSLLIPLKSDQTYPTIQSQLNSFFFSFGERPQFVNFYLQGEKVLGEFIGNVVMFVLVLKYCFKHISYMDWGQPNMETLKITPILFFPHL